MHPNRDFAAGEPLVWNAATLTEDLSLGTLVSAMACGDALIQQVAQAALLPPTPADRATVQHRQGGVRDAIRQPAIVRRLYDITARAIENRRRSWFAVGGRHPASLLSGAVALMRMHVDSVEQLRDVARSAGDRFGSAGFQALFATLEHELSEGYLRAVRGHLDTLSLRRGVPMHARLGAGNVGRDYRLQEPDRNRRSWWRRLLGKRQEHVYRVPERDEAGARALSDLRDRGLERVASALAQAVDHVDCFLHVLRTELAFYVGCLNLHDRLSALGAVNVLPKIAVAPALPSGVGIYDPCLALEMGRPLVGNDLRSDGEALLVITGANQGGKSTFLRALGVAQIMTQSGMFVPADEFQTGLHSSIGTHFKRGEDPRLKSGKLDEELARMSEMAGHLAPNALVLFNESFAATNEREGSEIARQIVTALLESGVVVGFVTHLHAFAHRMFEQPPSPAVFLRAERLADGTRTFRLLPGEPLSTSHGRDLFERVFARSGV